MDSKVLNELLKIFGEKGVNIIDEKTDWSKLPNLTDKKEVTINAQDFAKKSKTPNIYNTKRKNDE